MYIAACAGFRALSHCNSRVAVGPQNSIPRISARSTRNSACSTRISARSASKNFPPNSENSREFSPPGANFPPNSGNSREFPPAWHEFRTNFRLFVVFRNAPPDSGKFCLFVANFCLFVANFCPLSSTKLTPCSCEFTPSNTYSYEIADLLSCSAFSGCFQRDSRFC